MRDFKVKCIKAGNSENYEVGKIYYVKGGYLICEDGFGFGLGEFDSDNIDKVNNYCAFHPLYKFELVEEEKVFTKADIQSGDKVWMEYAHGIAIILGQSTIVLYTDHRGWDNLVGMFEVKKVVRPGYGADLLPGNEDNGKVVFDREKGIGCEEPKPEYKFKIMDIVKVTSTYEHGYPNYDTFIDKNAQGFKKFFINGGQATIGNRYTIVIRAKHSEGHPKNLYVVQDGLSLQVFIIDEDGLEKTE